MHEDQKETKHHFCLVKCLPPVELMKKSSTNKSGNERKHSCLTIQGRKHMGGVLKVATFFFLFEDTTIYM